MPEEWPQPTPPDLNNRPGERSRVKRPNRYAGWMIAAIILIIIFAMWWWLWRGDEETNTNTNVTATEEVELTNTNSDAAEEAVEETIEESVEMINAPLPILEIEETVPTGP